jgi:hypothetical protein
MIENFRAVVPRHKSQYPYSLPGNVPVVHCTPMFYLSLLPVHLPCVSLLEEAIFQSLTQIDQRLTKKQTYTARCQTVLRTNGRDFPESS